MKDFWFSLIEKEGNIMISFSKARLMNEAAINVVHIAPARWTNVYQSGFESVGYLCVSETV